MILQTLCSIVIFPTICKTLQNLEDITIEALSTVVQPKIQIFIYEPTKHVLNQ